MDAYETYGIADRALDRALAAENRAKELEKEPQEVTAPIRETREAAQADLDAYAAARRLPAYERERP